MEKRFLSLILDGYNDEMIAYNSSKSPNLEQINDMPNKAFEGKSLEGLILHQIKDGNSNMNPTNKD